MSRGPAPFNRRTVMQLLGRFALALALLGLAAGPPAQACGPKRAGKSIDVVICLDVSNSMDGLIASAKTKLWIIVNSIYCGGADDGDARDWREYAMLCGGKFANINQDAVVAIATPQDKELGELSGKLNETYVMYGRAAGEKKANQAAQDKNASL